MGAWDVRKEDCGVNRLSKVARPFFRRIRRIIFESDGGASSSYDKLPFDSCGSGCMLPYHIYLGGRCESNIEEYRYIYLRNSESSKSFSLAEEAHNPLTNFLRSMCFM